MAYLVNITSCAERDLAHLYREINAERSGAALKWYRASRSPFSACKSGQTAAPSRASETISGTCSTATSLTSIVQFSVYSRNKG